MYILEYSEIFYDPFYTQKPGICPIHRQYFLGGGYSYKTKFWGQDVDYVGLYTSRIDLILYLYSTINVPFLGLSHIFFYFSFLFLFYLLWKYHDFSNKRFLIFIFLLKNFIWQFLITFPQMGVKARNLRFGVSSYLIKPQLSCLRQCWKKKYKNQFTLIYKPFLCLS